MSIKFLLAAFFLIVSPTHPLASTEALAAEVDLWIRLGWGGGVNRQWVGTVSIDEGTFTEVRGLGLAADSPGANAIVGNGRQIQITQRGPRNYDGVDLHLVASPDATLRLDLVPQDAPQTGRHVEVPIRDVFGMKASFRGDLDDRRNRILVHRVPGDDLRLELDRDHLLFAAREPFQFAVRPHQLGLAEGPYRCLIQLTSVAGTELWREERDIKVDAQGAAEPVGPLSVSMPEAEGVYEFTISIVQRRLPVPLVRVPTLMPALTFRKMQVVVLDDVPPRGDMGNWENVLDIDLANPRVWDRVRRLVPPKILSMLGPEPLGEGASQTIDHLNERLTQLDPGGWVAVPLPVSEPGVPHRLRVDYPTDLRQTLGISIIEPDASGKVMNIGLDSGVDIPESPVTTVGQIESHSLVFWPRTRAPFVLLMNRRLDAAATFGRIRVERGPRLLPVSETVFRAPARSFALALEKPLFPENFGAGEALDTATQTTLEDWETFYLGATRLIQYLQYVGYDTLILPALHEGCALYPSRVLEPTPAYDRGAFFQDGRDPLRKDILELLFRLCDRHNIRLIPAVQFTTPLPKLEERMRERGEAGGILLVGEDGRTWVQRNGAHRGTAPYYNPLDQDVQAAMHEVIEELNDRYAGHPSYGGIAIALGPYSFAQLPDEEWGLDDVTIGRFASSSLAKDAKLDLPMSGASRFVGRASLLRGAGRNAWLAWRAQVIADFYRDLEQRVLRQRRDARLILGTGDVFQPVPLLDGNAYVSRYAHAGLRPTLPLRKLAVADAALKAGLDTATIRKESTVAIPRPTRIGPTLALTEQGIAAELARSTEVDTVFLDELGTALQYYEGQSLAFPVFDAVSPWGSENTRLRLFSHIVPGGQHARRWFVHALATGDPRLLIHAGPMAPMGQEEHWRTLLRIYRQLPAERLTPVASSLGNAANGCVVRSGRVGNQTYLCVINDLPWSNQLTLDLRQVDQARITSLRDGSSPILIPRGGAASFAVELAPWDMTAYVIDSPGAAVADWRLGPQPNVELELGQLVQEVRARTDVLRRREPIKVLENASFEDTEANGTIVGWEVSRASALRVSLDRSERHDGQSSLYMMNRDSNSVAWIRSQPFAAPKTGRVSCLVWLKTREPNRQPALRLAIEGRVNDRPYFRFARLGRVEDGAALEREQVTPIRSEWDSFLFHVDDLPPSGLTELHVIFELAGAGEVWLDNVAVYDRWFHTRELDELTKQVASAIVSLESGNYAHCERFLDGYWAKFMLEHVATPVVPRMAERPSNRESAPLPRTVPEASPSRTSDPNWIRLPKVPPLRIPFTTRNIAPK